MLSAGLRVHSLAAGCAHGGVGQAHKRRSLEKVITGRYHSSSGREPCYPRRHNLANCRVRSPLGCGRAKVVEDVGDGWPQLAAAGGAMAELLRFTLDDGSEVMFESAESDLVAPRGGQEVVREGGRLTERLHAVAEAAEEIAGALRSRLAPDEVSLEFGLKVSGGVNWFFANAQSEGTIKVTLKWAGNAATTPSAAQHETEPDQERG